MNLSQIQQLEEEIQQQHPHWPQDKARWIAMQALGMLTVERR